MTVTIGIAADDADQRWFWALLVTQRGWGAQRWDTQGPLPAASVAAWIALVPRCPALPAPDAAPWCAWLQQLTAPTLLLGTPLTDARAASAQLRVAHVLTTHAAALTYLDVLLPVVLATTQEQAQPQ